MAFFAIDNDCHISAREADPGKTYRCLECFRPVKLRQGAGRPHFYHTAKAPSCRLYSKSEDHLLIQLELQKILPQGETRMERPLLSIGRVADLVWETKKIAFEIQCSILFEPQADARIREYKEADLEIIWILDDRVFNKRNLRPAEEFLRSRPCYFASVRRFPMPPFFYDQNEILSGQRRVKKGRSLQVDFSKIHSISKPRWPENLPRQIEKRIPYSTRYFKGDLIDRTLRSSQLPFLASSLQYWRSLEESLMTKPPETHWFIQGMVRAFRRLIRDPYLAFLEALLERTNCWLL